MNTPAVKEAIEIEDIFLQDKIKRRAYEQREKAIRDYYSYINAYKEEGIQQGKSEGIEETKIANAINFLKLGIDISIIVKGTGLDIEKVKELQKSL